MSYHCEERSDVAISMIVLVSSLVVLALSFWRSMPRTAMREPEST